MERFSIFYTLTGKFVKKSLKIPKG